MIDNSPLVTTPNCEGSFGSLYETTICARDRYSIVKIGVTLQAGLSVTMVNIQLCVIQSTRSIPQFP